jgi:hypothetical protein
MTLTGPTQQTWNGGGLPVPPRSWMAPARRRRWWLIALVAVALVAGGLVYQRAVTTDALSFYGDPNVWRTGSADRDGISEIHNALGTDVTVSFVRNGPFVVRLGLVNGGRRDVRIRSLPKERAFYYRLEAVETSGQQSGGFRAFEPFTLRAGDTRWLQLHFRFADCDLQRSEEAHSSRMALRVRYSVLGFPRTGFVPFDKFALSVPSGDCDHPAL